MDDLTSNADPDLERRPEYWETWSDGADIIREQIRPIDEIEAESPDEQESLLRAIEDNREDHPNLGVLPVGGILEDVGMLVDRDTLEIIDVIYANPWPREET